MFLGTIPQSCRSALLEQARRWNVSDVYVACSGNFTVERTLAKLERFALHGCDVTIYSCSIGRWQAGKRKLGVNVQPEAEADWGWLQDYLETPADTVATLLLSTRMLQGLHRDTAYHERIRRAYRDNWAELHPKTVEKVAAAKVKLASFHVGDAVDWAAEAPKDAAMVSAPPFYAGGYEKLNENLEAVFRWTPPSYPSMDDTRRAQLIASIVDRKEWFLITDHELDGLDTHLHGLVKPTNRARPHFIYSSQKPTRLVMPRQKVEAPKAPYLGEDEEIGETLAIAKLPPEAFGAMRSAFLNPAIAPAAAEAVAVLVDGKIVGAFAFSTQTNAAFGGYDVRCPQPTIYLTSDFAIRPTRYRHLSKLVLMAALSREAQLHIERSVSRRTRSLVTSAFTNRPSSMKYRGLLHLLKRKELDPGGEWRYQIQYGAEIGRWTLQEALAQWKQRYAKETT